MKDYDYQTKQERAETRRIAIEQAGTHCSFCDKECPEGKTGPVLRGIPTRFCNDQCRDKALGNFDKSVR